MKKFDYTLFRGEVRKQIVVQNLGSYIGISEISGLNIRTIRSFMAGVRNNADTALAIKKALKITKNFGFEPKE